MNDYFGTVALSAFLEAMMDVFDTEKCHMRSFCCTPKGFDVMEKNKFARFSKMIKLVAEASGKFVGEILSCI